MRTIKAGWQEYAGLLPAEAHETQLRETEQAFYGGCVHLLGLLMETTDKPDDEGVEALDTWMTEANDRFRAILAEKFARERK